MIRDWRERGAVSRRAKLSATIVMAISSTILFLTTSHAWTAEAITALMAVVLMVRPLVLFFPGSPSLLPKWLRRRRHVLPNATHASASV